MNVIVCLDDAGGMAFNGRRQSKDRIVCEKIVSLVNGQKLWMTAYSKSLFEGDEAISVSDDFLQKAGPLDFCFVETQPFLQDAVTQIFAFYWNRRYPADVYLGFKPEDSGFYLADKTEFCGFSHEKITLCVFKRREGKR